jgi:hypothetical protein
MRISIAAGMRMTTVVALAWYAAGCAAGDKSTGRNNTGSQAGGGGSSQPSTSSSVAGSKSSSTASGGSGGSSSTGSGGSSSAGSSGSGGSASTSKGSGGSGGAAAGGSAGSSASAAVDCSALPLPTNMDDVISTFEDGTGAVNQAAGRGGGFYMFNDGTGMQTPAPGGLPDAAHMDRCGGMYALCMSGKNFTMWGAGMGTDLGPTAKTADGGMGAKTAYDASAYKGIAFWAKANPGSAVAIRVSLKDKNTAPEGGVCDAKMTSGAMACNDDWGKSISLTTDWKPYTLLWADLRQAGWGAAYSAFDVKHAYSVQLQVNKGLDFDLCIDDLIFVR